MPKRGILTIIRNDAEIAFHRFNKAIYRLSDEETEIAKRHFIDGYLECYIAFVQEQKGYRKPKGDVDHDA